MEWRMSKRDGRGTWSLVRVIPLESAREVFLPVAAPRRYQRILRVTRGSHRALAERISLDDYQQHTRIFHGVGQSRSAFSADDHNAAE